MKTIRTVVENSQQWKKCPIGTLLRVRDEDARKVVEKHEAEYVPKAEWKKLRDNETNNDKGASNA
jgi:cytochrome c-type biogenesis protein CcmE